MALPQSDSQDNRPESLQDLLSGIGNKSESNSKVLQGNTSTRSGNQRRQEVSRPPMGTAERRTEKERRKKQKAVEDAKLNLEIKQAEIKMQQHRRKILLAGCEPVMGLNFNSLAMDDYPDNAIVAAARRDRDYWVVLLALFGSLFFASLLGLVAPWIGGVGCGLAFLSSVFAFTPVRKYFFERPHLHELLAKRKTIEYTALHHVQYLEGVDGLAWRCEKLAKFNSNLEKNVFKGLYRYSKARDLKSYIINKKTIRLYLLLMIESQKAYKRLEKDYLESHFKHIDQGWDDRIDDAEAQRLEKMLNDVNTKGVDEQAS